MSTVLSTSSTTPPIPGKKILVVDDNAVVIKTICLKLQGAGFRVVTAMDGTEAVAAVRKENPDLILLDLTFPAEVIGVPWDGFRIMECLRPLEKKNPHRGHYRQRRPQGPGTRDQCRRRRFFPKTDRAR